VEELDGYIATDFHGTSKLHLETFTSYRSYKIHNNNSSIHKKKYTHREIYSESW